MLNHQTHITPDESLDTAIITAFTHNMVTDFRYFYDSIRRHYNGKIIVVPIDFDIVELDRLRSNDIITFDVSDQSVYRFKELEPTERWVQWAKPSIIKKIADEYELDIVLWLDADVIILKSLEPILEYIKTDILLIKDRFAPKSCLNVSKLYDGQESEVPINSGVFGFMPKRDSHIIDMWIDKTLIVLNNTDLKYKISLYDQGCLIWAINELKLNEKVINKKEWNYPAKKNVYDDSKPLKWIHEIDKINSCVIGEIGLDNQNATIAHFAGIPQLRHLLDVNNKSTVGYIRNRFGDNSQSRLFCVGLERCGTHTIAEIIRRSAHNPCWVKHELYPSMSKEAYLKYNNKNYKTKEFVDRMKLYNRIDTKLVCESNHRLGFMIEDIYNNVTNAKFILLLRDPVRLIKSRLLNFSMWPKYSNMLPTEYINDLSNLSKHFNGGSADQNIYRITPNSWTGNIIELHLFEITETIRVVMDQLKSINKNNYEIIWLENINNDLTKIERLIPNEIYWHNANRIKSTKFGACMNLHSKETEAWVDSIIDDNTDLILDRFYDTILKYNIGFNSADIMM